MEEWPGAAFAFYREVPSERTWIDQSSQKVDKRGHGIFSSCIGLPPTILSRLKKMSFGKLYGSSPDSARVWRSLAAAKLAGLDVEFVKTLPGQDSHKPEYLAINPKGKVPAFVGADGFVLTESRAIALYSTFDTFLVHQR